MLATIGVTSARLGPGAFSVDARLFGRSQKALFVGRRSAYFVASWVLVLATAKAEGDFGQRRCFLANDRGRNRLS
jgi:hypothetical protein